MGYCHSWAQRRPFSPEEWERISKDIKAILKHSGIALANPHGDVGSKPIFTKDYIGFNGEDDGCEPFELTPNGHGGGIKTDRDNYDDAVVACLCYLANLYDVDVGSDGQQKDWKDGLKLAREVLPDVKIRMPGFHDWTYVIDSD